MMKECCDCCGGSFNVDIFKAPVSHNKYSLCLDCQCQMDDIQIAERLMDNDIITVDDYYMMIERK